MQVLSGPPQRMRAGRVSMQVLSRDQVVLPPSGPGEGWGIPI
jgi:hypothetical protein